MALLGLMTSPGLWEQRAVGGAPPACTDYVPLPAALQRAAPVHGGHRGVHPGGSEDP